MFHAREAFAKLLRLAGVSGLAAERLESEFIQGAHDPRIEDLHMDSLASMELCILIENHYGVSIVPDRLMAHGSCLIVRIAGDDSPQQVVRFNCPH